jgi:hypothetical protein
MTDSHAQLLPIYFREPNVNIGLGEAYGAGRTWSGATCWRNSARSIRGRRMR